MSENENLQNPQELQIQIPPDIQRGAYANNMVVAHTQEEFVLDFIMATPPVGIVNARVVVSPSHAKRIAEALIENIQKYESRFGEVKSIPAGLPDDVTSH